MCFVCWPSRYGPRVDVQRIVAFATRGIATKIKTTHTHTSITTKQKNSKYHKHTHLTYKKNTQPISPVTTYANNSVSKLKIGRHPVCNSIHSSIHSSINPGSREVKRVGGERVLGSCQTETLHIVILGLENSDVSGTFPPPILFTTQENGEPTLHTQHIFSRTSKLTCKFASKRYTPIMGQCVSGRIGCQNGGAYVIFKFNPFPSSSSVWKTQTFCMCARWDLHFPGL